jgi:hypothetical protein
MALLLANLIEDPRLPLAGYPVLATTALTTASFGVAVLASLTVGQWWRERWARLLGRIVWTWLWWWVVGRGIGMGYVGLRWRLGIGYKGI